MPTAPRSPAPWSTCGTPTPPATTRASSTAPTPARRARDSTFLRGSQPADAEGIVEFGTVYPGWYPGRAVHVHVKAHLDGATVLTSQLYFPDDVTDAVHGEDPYADHGTRDTQNADDGIAGDPASAGNLVTTSAAGDGTLGLVVSGRRPRRPPDGPEPRAGGQRSALPPEGTRQIGGVEGDVDRLLRGVAVQRGLEHGRQRGGHGHHRHHPRHPERDADHLQGDDARGPRADGEGDAGEGHEEPDAGPTRT